MWLGVQSFERQRQALDTLRAEKLATELQTREQNAAETALADHKGPIARHFFRMEGGAGPRGGGRRPGGGGGWGRGRDGAGVGRVLNARGGGLLSGCQAHEDVSLAPGDRVAMPRAIVWYDTAGRRRSVCQG